MADLTDEDGALSEIKDFEPVGIRWFQANRMEPKDEQPGTNSEKNHLPSFETTDFVLSAV